MPTKLETTDIKSIFAGTTPLVKAFLGDTQVWAPNSGLPVDFVTAASARNGSAGANRSCSAPVDVDNNDDVYMLVLGGIGHVNWINSIATYGTMTVSSHLDGNLTYLGGVQNGATGSRQGAALAWGMRPTTLAASHTINMFVQSPSQWVECIEFTVLIYRYVAAVGAVTTYTRDGTSAAVAANVLSTSTQDKAVFGLVGGAIPTVTAGTQRQQIGASETGQGDYLTALDKIGGAPSVPFAASNAHVHCGVGVNLLGYAA